MRALVTGAAGFIGSTLTDELLREVWQVTALDNFSDYYSRDIKQQNIAAAQTNPGCTVIEGDLATDDIGQWLDGVDVVFHLAARPGVRGSWGASFEAYARDNILATQRLLEACQQRDVRVILASSSSIYGESETHPTPETAPPKPISPYGLTKLAAEQLAWLYRRQNGLDFLTFRFFTVYGPRQRPDMFFHKLCRAAIDGTPIDIYGDGEQLREFTYVGDIVSALMAAIDGGEPGETYNLGGGHTTSVNEAVALVEAISGRKLIARYAEPQPGDVRLTSAYIAKARHAFGYSPATSLEEGLEREYRWLLGL